MNSAYHYRFFFNRVSAIVLGIIFFFFLSIFFVPLSQGEEPFFSIALSSFTQEKDAISEVSKLIKSGNNAFYRKEKSPGKESPEYQVYIEKYSTRDEADNEAQVLKDLDLISDYSVREVKDQPEIPQKIELPPPGKKEKPELSPTEPKPEPKKKISRPKPAIEKQITKSKPKTKAEPKTETTKKTSSPKPPKTVIKPEPKPGKVSLQIGSFKDEANAAALKIKLNKLGKNTFYNRESVSGKGEFYRLYITGYESLNKAIKDAKSLVKSGLISGYTRVHNTSILSKNLEKKKKTAYFIHVSSNKKEDNARETVARLKEYGHKAFYVLEKKPSDIWYRVYIGEFKNEAKARKMGMELLDRGIISYFKPLAINTNNLDKQAEKTRN